MSEQVCPVAYDHNDDLDECGVCGWRPGVEVPMEPERVTLVAHHGPEWEADIIERLSTGCCVVVRWTGRTPHPGLNNPATVCLNDVREVRYLTPTPPTAAPAGIREATTSSEENEA